MSPVLYPFVITCFGGPNHFNLFLLTGLTAPNLVCFKIHLLKCLVIYLTQVLDYAKLPSLNIFNSSPPFSLRRKPPNSSARSVRLFVTWLAPTSAPRDPGDALPYWECPFPSVSAKELQSIFKISLKCHVLFHYLLLTYNSILFYFFAS